MTVNKIRVDTKAEYSIRVAGFLDQSWSDRLNGMAVMNASAGQNDKNPVTTLIGPLVDQAALFGVLNTLYNMRLPLISVECLDNFIEEQNDD